VGPVSPYGSELRHFCGNPLFMGYTKSVASMVAPVTDPALFPRRVFLFNLLALIPVKTSPPAQTPLQVAGRGYMVSISLVYEVPVPS
jgi:hypothetical protein